MREKLKLYTYYIIIGIVSFIALVFLPMVGSEIGLDWNTPNSTVGWIVWVTTRVIISVINVLIFYCFMEQAKVNVAEDPQYMEGKRILGLIKTKEYHPRSPKQWTAKQYGSKGTTIFISSALATIALTQAVLSYDYVTMLTYLFTIIMGLIFGVLQMKKAELYWTTEFYDYAKLMEENNNDN